MYGCTCDWYTRRGYKMWYWMMNPPRPCSKCRDRHLQDRMVRRYIDLCEDPVCRCFQTEVCPRECKVHRFWFFNNWPKFEFISVPTIRGMETYTKLDNGNVERVGSILDLYDFR